MEFEDNFVLSSNYYYIKVEIEFFLQQTKSYFTLSAYLLMVLFLFIAKSTN